jgi:hypothetical protein
MLHMGALVNVWPHWAQTLESVTFHTQLLQLGLHDIHLPIQHGNLLAESVLQLPVFGLMAPAKDVTGDERLDGDAAG